MQVDQAVNSIKLTSLPSALIWSHVALLGMRNKQLKKRKVTRYMCIYVDLFYGYESPNTVVYLSDSLWGLQGSKPSTDRRKNHIMGARLSMMYYLL